MLTSSIAALGRACLVAGVAALTALGTAAPVEHESHTISALGQPAIQAQHELPTDHLTAPESVELVSVELRSVVRAATSSSTTSERANPLGQLHLGALRWCDVVQCRRIAGAMLLGFATPPPAHR